MRLCLENSSWNSPISWGAYRGTWLRIRVAVVGKNILTTQRNQINSLISYSLVWIELERTWLLEEEDGFIVFRSAHCRIE